MHVTWYVYACKLDDFVMSTPIIPTLDATTVTTTDLDCADGDDTDFGRANGHENRLGQRRRWRYAIWTTPTVTRLIWATQHKSWIIWGSRSYILYCTQQYCITWRCRNQGQVIFSDSRHTVCAMMFFFNFFYTSCGGEVLYWNRRKTDGLGVVRGKENRSCEMSCSKTFTIYLRYYDSRRDLKEE